MSTVVGITTFLVIKDSNNTVIHRFQNSQTDTTVSRTGVPHNYLSFIYQGAAKNRTGDNMEAQLVLSNNPISMGYANQAVVNKWNIEVTTCSMQLPQFTVARVLATEKWLAASLVYDFETIEITLSSSIDAVGASVPHRVLTTSNVGSLPTSGQIQSA